MGMAPSDTSSERSPVPVEGTVEGSRRDAGDEPRDLTADERASFLEYVVAHRDCTVKEAADHVGVWRRDIKALRRTDPEFEEEYRTARGYGAEQIFNQMVKLAIDGVDEPLVSMGEIVGTKRVYSERLLQTMYNSLTPEGREAVGHRVLEVTGPGGKALQAGVPLADVLDFMRQHVPQARVELEAETAEAGEIVDETDDGPA